MESSKYEKPAKLALAEYVGNTHAKDQTHSVLCARDLQLALAGLNYQVKLRAYCVG